MASEKSEISEDELDSCYTAVLEVTRKAGQMIRDAFSVEKRVETKSSAADLVTETDKNVEDLIISTLKSKFPTHTFIGEESTAAGVKNEFTDNPTWMIDPVDGTTNFVHRYPFVAVSIALLVNKKVQIGVIYNAILDHMFTARRGQGAYKNDQRIFCGKTESLSQSLVLSEFGSGRDADLVAFKIGNIHSVLKKVHGVRCTGSAALAMCQVACNGADAYFEFGIHCWDYAAGALIAEEAGAFVMDTAGGPVDFMSRRVLCATTEILARELSNTIKQIEMERD